MDSAFDGAERVSGKEAEGCEAMRTGTLRAHSVVGKAAFIS
jgi:hypothetical protein